MKIKYTAGIFLLVTMVMFLTACGKKVEEPVSLTGVPIGVVVGLPRDMKNAESDAGVLKKTAVVVSVPISEEFYIGAERFPKEQLGERISRLLEGQPADGRMVYVAAGDLVNYYSVVQILLSARKEGVNSAALLVARQPGTDAPNVFKIQIPAELDPFGLLPEPDPRTLLVSIGADDKVELNTKPMGDPLDTAKLAQTLTQVFQQRKEPEKTVIIKPLRSTNYVQVVRVLDAARGAGASAIILQLEDLGL